MTYFPVTLGTAGHIDHGKTALVQALTGVDTDRLAEERKRGISIELGFAPLELPSGRRLSVVDVPGHERFVRTMVAGASGIDLFLGVVAADDGVMPQTKEHLAVLELLKVPAGVVAVTKTDLVSTDGLELAVEETRELLAGGPYSVSPVVPVCALSGRGLDELLAALDRAASELDRRPLEGGAPRLHVDRSFTLKGIGTVVTGTLWSGSLGVGDEVRVEPSGIGTRVRSVQVHGESCERAAAGQRVALNLAGVDRQAVERGDVVTSAGAGLEPTYLIDAAVELLPHAAPLRRGARLHLHHGTRETPARVAPVEGEILEPGRRAYAQLRLQRPIVATAGDRLVLRQVAPLDTVGGGIVVDAGPRKHGAGREHVERLRLLERADPLERLGAELADTPSGLGEREADRELLERLSESGGAVRIGEAERRYFAPLRLEAARERLLAAVTELGTGRPASGRALAHAAGLSERAARSVLDELVREGEVSAQGPGYLLPVSARVAGDPGAGRLVEALGEDGLEPRGVAKLGAAAGLERGEASELLERLVVAELLVRVKPGLYYHPDALAEARRFVAAICERDGAVTIARLRDELATSRKYAQALLEYFDAQGHTRRQGDRHVLRRSGHDRASASRTGP